jgi:hypothetical protein
MIARYDKLVKSIKLPGIRFDTLNMTETGITRPAEAKR